MKIAVHSGKFHADDCLAVYMLHQTEKFKNAQVIRTRDQSIIDQCDVACDVGTVYDPEKYRFDHHQLGFNEKYPGKEIPLSSCGLVYLHFGQEIIEHFAEKYNVELTEDSMKLVKDILYDNLIMEVDAIDNGVSMCPGMDSAFSFSTDISSRVDRLNSLKLEGNEAFEKAVDLVGKEFERVISIILTDTLPAYNILKVAYEKRFEIDPRGIILEINENFDPRFILQYVEKEDEPEVLFFIQTKEEGKWRVKAFSVNSTFTPRCLLPYGGSFNDELTEKSGIPGGIFCHKNGFLAVFKERESVIKFAQLAYEMNYKKEQ